LADVECGDRQDRREQQIVALEEDPHALAQGVALEHRRVVSAQVLAQRGLQQIGDGGIELVTLPGENPGETGAAGRVALRAPSPRTSRWRPGPAPAGPRGQAP